MPTPEQKACGLRWIRKIRLDLLRRQYKNATSERKRYFIERKANKLIKEMDKCSSMTSPE